MESFEWVDATSVEQAAALLASGANNAVVVAKAGGIDLVDLIKEGIVRPDRVVNLRTIPGLDTIAVSSDIGLTIGALATLAHIESSGDVRRAYPALAEAAGHAATPQVRNAGTIGGNLMQRPRCWYLRSRHFHDGRTDVHAAITRGENDYHAIFENERTAIVHASTPATALIAYGAQVHLTSAGGTSRVVALKDLLLPPDISRDRDVAVRRGEVLTQVVVPPTSATTKAAYHKQTERDSYDWPICDVAVVLQMNGSRVQAASIVGGWVAPTPRRFEAGDRVLVGQTITEDTARRAARAAVAGATPLAKNAYKVPVLEAVIRRTILAAARS